MNWIKIFRRGQIIESRNLAQVAKATGDVSHYLRWNAAAAHHLDRLGGMMGQW